MAETIVETERLRLREWRIEDAGPFIRHLNTEPVMRWLGGVRRPQQQESTVRERFIRWQEERGFTFWVVERKQDCELLGFCGLKIGDDPGSPVEGAYEIGWRLREDVWGQGYAREAAAACLDYAFARLGAERVVALTVAGNEPSWGLMLRLGMTPRPELGYAGAEWTEGPVIVYDIGREQWGG